MYLFVSIFVLCFFFERLLTAEPCYEAEMPDDGGQRPVVPAHDLEPFDKRFPAVGGGGAFKQIINEHLGDVHIPPGAFQALYAPVIVG